MKTIAITSGVSEYKNYIGKSYIKAFTTKNTVPVIIPVFDIIKNEVVSKEEMAELEQICDNLSEKLDALVLNGGNDINPVNYFQPNLKAFNCSNARDLTDISLATAFIKKNKPILGMCRGFQVLGLMFGLKYFIQDLEEVEELHTATLNEFSREEPAHSIYVLGRFKDWLVKNNIITDGDLPQINVNSFHHEGFLLLPSAKKVKEVRLIDYVQKFNDDLEITATTRAVIEGFVHKSKPIMAIQWHPEAYESSIFIRYWLDNFLLK